MQVGTTGSRPEMPSIAFEAIDDTFYTNPSGSLFQSWPWNLWGPNPKKVWRIFLFHHWHEQLFQVPTGQCRRASPRCDAQRNHVGCIGLQSTPINDTARRDGSTKIGKSSRCYGSYVSATPCKISQLSSVILSLPYKKNIF